MRIVDLPFGGMCAGCEQQAMASVTSLTADPLRRYYGALARGESPLGLYHTKFPLTSAVDYLKTLEIPGWQIYHRPVRYNSSAHKAYCVRKAAPGLPETKDIRAGASCNNAAAGGGRQSGQIWLIVGEWRPDEANNLVAFREVSRELYASVLLLRNRKVYAPIAIISCLNITNKK
jgi:hypothetical protein